MLRKSAKTVEVFKDAFKKEAGNGPDFAGEKG
jgi:hypothetical protein